MSVSYQKCLLLYLQTEYTFIHHHKETPFLTSLMEKSHGCTSLVTFKLAEVDYRNLHLFLFSLVQCEEMKVLGGIYIAGGVENLLPCEAT